ncbi:hypothetical protein [Nocardia pseudobrasiliensis]|uniref:hypothetical protein n=1 Tax=Nocardia pseudobrasiliensis TaxID=45979 RepID=UPI0011C069A6|nr:hypothetical protein [Nocardia pseudobrasiliensis]
MNEILSGCGRFNEVPGSDGVTVWPDLVGFVVGWDGVEVEPGAVGADVGATDLEARGLLRRQDRPAKCLPFADDTDRALHARWAVGDHPVRPLRLPKEELPVESNVVKGAVGLSIRTLGEDVSCGDGANR